MVLVGAYDEQRKRELPRILLGEKLLTLSSCLAGAGLLAFVWLSKFGDHLPLYRQETITKRFGVPLARSTLCQWMLDLADALRELYQVMISETLRSRVVHTDDTTVQRQDPETGQLRWNLSGVQWPDHRGRLLAARAEAIQRSAGIRSPRPCGDGLYQEPVRD